MRFEALFIACSLGTSLLTIPFGTVAAGITLEQPTYLNARRRSLSTVVRGKTGEFFPSRISLNVGGFSGRTR
jgi:hypothetical protein